MYNWWNVDSKIDNNNELQMLCKEMINKIGFQNDKLMAIGKGILNIDP